MIVEVAPENAVIWTKPDDWQVDLKNPRQGLERADRKTFTTAFADGWARVLPVRIKEETLKALLTRAGQEVIDTPFDIEEE